MNKRKSLISILAIAVALVLSVFCLGACGTNINGTYKFVEARKVQYGEMEFDMTFYWDLAVKGDDYVLTIKTNANGMVIISDFSGKCSTEDNKITCLKPTSANQYSGVVDDDNNIIVDPDNSAPTKVEGEELIKKINTTLGTSFFDKDKTSIWTVDKEAKTAVPVGYVA